MGHIKSKKALKRLQTRRDNWDAMKADNTIGEKVKVLHKPCGAVLAFTKPGSLNK